MLVIVKSKKFEHHEKFLLFFSIITFWELIEANLPFITPENKIDLIYDFIIGMLGGSIVFYKTK